MSVNLLGVLRFFGCSRLTLFLRLKHFEDEHGSNNEHMSTVVHLKVHLMEVLKVKKPEGHRKVTAGSVVEHHNACILHYIGAPALEQWANHRHGQPVMCVHQESAKEERNEAWVESMPDR